jgi:predicted small lipoprotein YifL
VNRRTLMMGAALTVVLVSVAGCGRRGPLEAPIGASVAPRPAASDRMIAPFAQATAPDSDLDDPAQLANPGARSGQTRQVQVEPAPVDPAKPDKPFFLDPLVK